MDVIACALYLIIVVIVIGWVLYEIRADKRDRIKPTVPGLRERLPPKSDV